MRKVNEQLVWTIAAGLFAGLVDGAWALHPAISFQELAQGADVIFVGRVAAITPRAAVRGPMIFSDLRFDEVEVLLDTPEGRAFTLDPVLSFAGGQVGDRGVSVSGVPRFEVGEHVLLFVKRDGAVYANPIVGGSQGDFRLLVDPDRGVRYPTRGGFGVTEAGVDLRLTASPLVGIRDGRGVLRGATVPGAPAPLGAAPVDTAGNAADTAAQTVELVDLAGLVASARTLRTSPLREQPRLRLTSSESPPPGALPTASLDHVPVPSGAWPSADLANEEEADFLIHTPGPPGSPWAAGTASSRPGAMTAAFDSLPAKHDVCSESLASSPLCYCGYHSLDLVMQQVPEGWWSYTHNNDSMWQYNQFMDVYRYTPSDGTWGNNGQNEFGGWPSEQDLLDIWGFGWNGALAMTIQTWSGNVCAVISQSDIVFNPSYFWYEELASTLGHPDRILYRSVLMHELGHSWGMQRGSCVEDYSYDHPSVMHAYYSWVVEDGWGIHFWDAYALRRLYDDQTGVISRTDVGAESYYASSGLHNAWTNQVTFQPGDPITVSGLTVENMSNQATAGVRVRLWLSTNTIISESDYPIGSFWYWDSFPAETYWSGSLDSTIPDVPAGTYYVGVIATVGGGDYSWDDLSFNNATFLPTPIEVVGCLDDAFEPDDSCFGGTIALGQVQSRKHCDEDWLYFVPTPGHTYRIETRNLIGGADTILALHENCGAPLAVDDDGGGGLASRIDWTATSSQPLDLRVSEFGDAYAPGEGYDVTVESLTIFNDGFESGDTSAWQ